MSVFILLVMSSVLSIGSPSNVQVHVEGIYLSSTECNAHKLEHPSGTAFCVKAE